MSLPSILTKPIYIATYIANDPESNEPIYDEPQLIYAQKEDVRSYISRNAEGIAKNYDRVILVPYGDKASFINEQTHLWLDCIPNSRNSNMDYIVARVGDVDNGVLPLFCNALGETKTMLYYEDRGKTHPFIIGYSRVEDGSVINCDLPKNVYQVKVNYKDFEAFIPYNKNTRIYAGTKVWLTKPTSVDSTQNLLRCTRRERVPNGWKLTFEKVV